MNPLSWIHSMFSYAWNGIKDFAGGVEKAVVWVWNTLVDVFVVVYRGWEWMIHGVEALAGLIEDGFDDIYKFGAWVVKTGIPDVISWAARQLSNLGHEIAKGLSDVEHWVSGLIADVKGLIDDVYTWAVDHVYNPLKKDFDQAWHWIANEGVTIWHYIEHPELLAKLLFLPLWHYFLSFVKDSAALIGGWFIPHIYRAMIETADVLESILSDII